MRKVKVEAKALNENLVDQFLIFQPEAPNPLDPTYAPSSNLPNPERERERGVLFIKM